MSPPRLLIHNELIGVLEKLALTLIHDVANKNHDKKDSVIVEIRKDLGSGKAGTFVRNLRLTESGKDTGVFEGIVRFTPDKKRFEGDIEAQPGELFSFSYDTSQLGTLRSLKKHVTIKEIVEVQAWDPEFVVDKDLYDVDDEVTLSISDPTAGKDPFAIDSISLNVISDSDSKGVKIFLKETGLNTKVFRGKFKLRGSKTKHSVKVKPGDIVTAVYKTEFHADYVEGEEDKAFFFTFPVGVSLYNEITIEKKLNRIERYHDRLLLEKMNTGDDLLWTKNKTITIVFWDIREFSRMCEILKAHPNLIREFLRDYFTLSTRIIYKHGGVLDKFIGDGIMGLFGVFGKSKDLDKDTISAVEAALEFKQEFQRMLEKWTEKWGKVVADKIEIGLGCGMNTGEVIVGNIESEQRDQFTALGRNVNIASRLEGRADKMQILVSETTKNRINDRFELVYKGMIDDIKNIPGTFDYYEVISKR